MKKMCSITVLLSLLFTFANAFANSDVIEEGFQRFSSCDDTFFKSIGDSSDQWSKVATIKKTNGFGRIVVPKRLGTSSEVLLKKNITVNGVQFDKYVDEFIDLGSLGVIYNWGFITTSTADEVFDALMPLIWDSNRLIKDGQGVLSRTEVKVLGSPWIKRRLTTGQAAGTSKTERVLFIEHDSNKKMTRVTCSLQGRVAADVLKEIRPDILESEYPQEISADLFEKTVVPPKVLQTITDVTKKSNLWGAKFKSGYYLFDIVDETKESSRRTKNDLIRVELKGLPNGTFTANEVYSPNFNVDRLLFSFVQLKSRMNGFGDGKVFLTTQLKLNLPKELVLGGQIAFTRAGENVPKQASAEIDKPISSVCEVSKKINASEINPSLIGIASILSCDKNTQTESEYAFLESYGLNLTMSSTYENNKSNYVYKEIHLEQ